MQATYLPLSCGLCHLQLGKGGKGGREGKGKRVLLGRREEFVYVSEDEIILLSVLSCEG